MISLKNRFIFIHITKCGGTSISSSLRDDSCILNEGSMPHILKVKYPLNHLTLKDIEDSKIIHPNYEKFFKFTFVRNPFSRILSEYFWLKSRMKLSGDIKKELINLSGYYKKGCYGNHCMLQSNFITNIKDLNFIGKIENAQTDLNKLCSKLNLPLRKIVKTNKTKHKHYTEYYDRETREIIENSYQKDLELFGYQFGD